MKKEKIVKCLLGIFSLGFLAGCADDATVSTNNTASQDDTQTDELNIVKNENLAVNQNKCIGCGKCARTAPDNFEMDATTHKAKVKSMEITNQAAVDQAVKNCPAGAITQ